MRWRRRREAEVDRQAVEAQAALRRAQDDAAAALEQQRVAQEQWGAVHRAAEALRPFREDDRLAELVRSAFGDHR